MSGISKSPQRIHNLKQARYALRKILRYCRFDEHTVKQLVDEVFPLTQRREMKKAKKKAGAGMKDVAKRAPAAKRKLSQVSGKDPGARYVRDEEPDNPFLGIMNND